MQTTIDEAGRLIISKEIQTQAGLVPGTVLDIRWRDGHLEVELSPLEIEFTRKGRLLVAVPKHDAPPLTTDCVEATRQLAHSKLLPSRF